MSELSYSERLFLVLYKELYGKEYDCRCGHDGKGEVNKEHIQAQKAVYLFSQCNIYVNDYAFVWDKRGPFSPGLLRLLRDIDCKEASVKSFYEIYSHDESHTLESLLTEKEIERMRNLVDAIGGFFKEHQDSLCETAEMLGSVVFLSQKVIPEGKVEELQNELYLRKPYLNVRMQPTMWEALKKTGLVLI